jgi:hypothetical protein
VRALIKACSNRTSTGVRNRALIVLLYRAGCRVSEALRLLPKDLDRAAGTATVLRGKGGKRRTIGLDPGAFAVVERWLDVRTKLGISSRALVICTLKGKPVASAYVRALMPRLACRAGIEKRVHAHGLRHTHAAAVFPSPTPGCVRRPYLATGHRPVGLPTAGLVPPGDHAGTRPPDHTLRRSGSGRAGRRRTHGSYARRANTPFVPRIGESQLIDVSTIEAGRITRLEVFALEDRATAMARFAALRRDVGNSGRDLRRARA